MPEPSSNSLTPLLFTQFLLHVCQALGHEPEELLQQAGITYCYKQIMQGNAPELGSRDCGALHIQLVQRWHKEAGYENANIPVELNTLRHLCYAIIHCHSLDDVMDKVADFCAMFVDGQDAIKKVVDPQEVTLYLRGVTPRPATVLVAEIHGLMLVHRLLSWLTGEFLPLSGVGFRGQPFAGFRTQDLALMFDCDFRFNCADNFLKFPRDVLQRRLVRSVAALEEFLQQPSYHLLMIPYPEIQLAERIRQMLGEQIDQDMPSFEQVTSMLNISATTLRRNLRKENTSYQQIKDDFRRDIAIRLLTGTDLNVETISLRTGFSDANTFRRAFKKWVGMAPSDYRERHLSGLSPAAAGEPAEQRAAAEG